MCKKPHTPIHLFCMDAGRVPQLRQAILKNSVTDKLLQLAQTEGRVNPNLSNHKPGVSNTKFLFI